MQSQRRSTTGTHAIWQHAMLWLLAFLCFTCASACIEQAERVCEDDDNCSSTTGTLVCIKKRCVPQICTPNTAQACYSGAKDTKGVGACAEGRQLCIGRGTQWSTCYAETLPTTEICDGLDNNCDGNVDEGLDCKCKAGEKRFCYTGAQAHATATNDMTSCRQGTQTCASQGTWGVCAFERLPLQEVRTLLRAKANSDDILAALNACRDLDIDCDGKADVLTHCTCQAGETRECHLGPPSAAGKGTCGKGLQTCSDEGLWGSCLGDKVRPPVNEDVEGCNGKDDDCDGLIDNQTGTTAPLWRSCGTGCNIQTCPKSVDTTWGACEEKELCANQYDDDCDGKVDETDCKND